MPTNRGLSATVEGEKKRKKKKKRIAETHSRGGAGDIANTSPRPSWCPRPWPDPDVPVTKKRKKCPMKNIATEILNEENLFDRKGGTELRELQKAAVLRANAHVQGKLDEAQTVEPPAGTAICLVAFVCSSVCVNRLQRVGGCYHQKHETLARICELCASAREIVRQDKEAYMQIKNICCHMA